MLVVAKTPPIRVEVFGEGMDELVAVLKKAIPGVTITPEPGFDDDEFVKPEDIPWFREIRENWHPGETIRIRRENAGMTQAELAARMGTQAPAVARLEKSLATGKHSPSLDTLRRYVQACGKHLHLQVS